MLKETAFAVRSDGFENCIDGEKRLLACLDRAAEIPPHLNKRKQLVQSKRLTLRRTVFSSTETFALDNREPHE
jgi:hypothetical protein